jgi:hypothetical protein
MITAKLFEYNVRDLGRMIFFGNELNDRPDFYVSSNTDSFDIDLLIFFDSRGISGCFDGSVVDRIIRKVEKTNRYLLIARPLEITTWMTLYNFTRLNNIKPGKVITNMGFVDFTPKKMSIVEKSTIQYDCYFHKDQAEIIFLEEYRSQNDESLDLYMQQYPDSFKRELELYFKGIPFLILNTPLLRSGYQFERPRPVSFFTSVENGNSFNRELNLDATVFDFADFTETQTYDGVHYTQDGNELIFSSIESYL